SKKFIKRFQLIHMGIDSSGTGAPGNLLALNPAGSTTLTTGPFCQGSDSHPHHPYIAGRAGMDE
ncbi:hypothetical protein ABTF49_19155, partial [Acinetobacter baumannii]